MASKIEKEYAVLREEVKKVKKRIDSFVKGNPQADRLYTGCGILLSPLFPRPKIMLIGWNPGAGRLKDTGNRLNVPDRLPELEYLSKENGGYTLAKETIEVFKKARRFHYLRRAVKTNYIYFGTSNKTTCDRLLTLLRRKGIVEDPYKQADDWTKRLVGIVNPQTIICEGMNSFCQLCRLFDPEHPPKRTKDSCTVRRIDNRDFIGYRRHRNSSIVDKAKLAKCLAKYLPR